MSHPVSSHDRSNEYPEDKSSYGRALKKAKVPKMSKTVGSWAKHLRKVIKDNS